jgi:hypothetical protein
MLINDANSNASFRSYEIALSRRLSNRWLFLGSYSATKSHSPYVQNTSGVGDFVQPGLAVFLTTFDPNAEIFAANDTWEWLTRASGGYTFPWDILVSAHFENRSGIPFARTVSATGGVTIPSIAVRVEPIGTRRTSSVNILDFRGEKALRFGAQRLSLRVNLYNMLNVNTVTSLNQQSGATFLGATAIVPPRTAEVSAQFTF